MTNSEKALGILYNYSGDNGYIRSLRRRYYDNGETDAVGDFQVEYILRNKDRSPVEVNRVVKIADWYGVEKQKAWSTDFVPEKILIMTYFGDTALYYHCKIKYRKSVEPMLCFIPKRAVINNFFVNDYHRVDVDFDRYDRLSMEKDKNRVLLPHQKEGVKFLLDRRKCILADDQGTGKTTTMSVAAIEGNFDSVVIICPVSVKTNWKRELSWYVNEDDVTIVDSFTNKTKNELEEFLGYGVGKSGKKRDELLQEAVDNGKWQNNRFVIVNFDVLTEFFKLPRSRSQKSIDETIEKSPLLRYIRNRKSLIIVDEAHKLSNSTSNRYKVISNLIRLGEPHSVYLATGTPVTNAPENLYCLLKLLDDPIKDDYQYYMERYCGAKKICAPQDREKRNGISDRFVRSKGKSSWYALTDEEKKELEKEISKSCRMINITGDAVNLDELKERISHIYLRREKTDLGGLPEKRLHEVYYDLDVKQQEEYDRLWDEYEAAQKEADPEKVINKDLLEGAIYRRYISNAMVPYTEKLCDSILSEGRKVVIACCYDEELYTLQEYYSDKCVIYNGKMSLKQKDNAISSFINDDSKKVFIGNIVASGVGINLVCSNCLIYNDLSYVYAENSQMEDRIYRIGQTKDVDIYYQIFRNTQYQHMWDIVLRKKMISTTLIKKESEK